MTNDHACAEKSLILTSANGRILHARYLGLVGSNVRTENAQGRKYTVLLTGFSSADYDYVKRAFGLPLFAVPLPLRIMMAGAVLF